MKLSPCNFCINSFRLRNVLPRYHSSDSAMIHALYFALSQIVAHGNFVIKTVIAVHMLNLCSAEGEPHSCPTGQLYAVLHWASWPVYPQTNPGQISNWCWQIAAKFSATGWAQWQLTVKAANQTLYKQVHFYLVTVENKIWTLGLSDKMKCQQFVLSCCVPYCKIQWIILYGKVEDTILWNCNIYVIDTLVN